MKLFKRPNKIVLVQFPDGEVGKVKLLATTVRKHNAIADRCNLLFDKVHATNPGDPDPLTEKEVEFVLSTLPEGSVYEHDSEHGWSFVPPEGTWTEV